MMNVFAAAGFDTWAMDFVGYGRSPLGPGNSDVGAGVADLEAALPILERYRNEMLTFNDDIQGTAAVVLAALSAAAAATGSRVREQRVAMLGAGSASIGVCEQVVRSMVADGLSERDARARIYVVDIDGLLTTDRADLDQAQRRLAQLPAAVPSRKPGRHPDLTDVIVEHGGNPNSEVTGGAIAAPIARDVLSTLLTPH